MSTYVMPLAVPLPVPSLQQTNQTFDKHSNGKPDMSHTATCGAHVLLAVLPACHTVHDRAAFALQTDGTEWYHCYTACLIGLEEAHADLHTPSLAI